MAKKTKTGQQRSKEEQWRKRMAAQAQTRATVTRTIVTRTVVEQDEAEYSPVADDATEHTPTPTSARATSGPAAATLPRQTRSQAVTSTAAAVQRRASSASAARSARMRLAMPALSIEEEMHYVRSDIRRLIILTAICIVVLIALAFLINK